MEDRLLDYIALGVLIFVVLTIIYGGMFIHDIPYQMAKKRNHPHTEAIHTACWVSLLLLHIIWPFLWIWASLYKPDVGWNMNNAQIPKEPIPEDKNEDLELLDESDESDFIQSVEADKYDEVLQDNINLKNEIELLEQRLSILENRLSKEED